MAQELASIHPDNLIFQSADHIKPAQSQDVLNNQINDFFEIEAFQKAINSELAELELKSWRRPNTEPLGFDRVEILELHQIDGELEEFPTVTIKLKVFFKEHSAAQVFRNASTDNTSTVLVRLRFGSNYVMHTQVIAPKIRHWNSYGEGQILSNLETHIAALKKESDQQEYFKQPQIMIIGRACTGKTTLTQRLGQVFGMAPPDDVHNQLFLTNKRGLLQASGRSHKLDYKFQIKWEKEPSSTTYDLKQLTIEDIAQEVIIHCAQVFTGNALDRHDTVPIINTYRNMRAIASALDVPLILNGGFLLQTIVAQLVYSHKDPLAGYNIDPSLRVKTDLDILRAQLLNKPDRDMRDFIIRSAQNNGLLLFFNRLFNATGVPRVIIHTVLSEEDYLNNISNQSTDEIVRRVATLPRYRETGLWYNYLTNLLRMSFNIPIITYNFNEDPDAEKLLADLGKYVPKKTSTDKVITTLQQNTENVFLMANASESLLTSTVQRLNDANRIGDLLTIIEQRMNALEKFYSLKETPYDSNVSSIDRIKYCIEQLESLIAQYPTLVALNSPNLNLSEFSQSETNRLMPMQLLKRLLNVLNRTLAAPIEN